MQLHCHWNMVLFSGGWQFGVLEEEIYMLQKYQQHPLKLFSGV